MKKIALMICIFFSIHTSYGQGWVGAKPDTVFAASKDRSFNKIRVGIGTDAPKEQLHTTGEVRFEGLPSGLDTNIVVQDPITKNLHIRGISTMTKGNGATNAWLLSGNATSGTEYIGTNVLDDFRIYTNGRHRASYTRDTNYFFGTGHLLTNSRFTTLQGENLEAINTRAGFVAGINSRINTINPSISNTSLGFDCDITGGNSSFNSAIGAENLIDSSDYSHILGTHNTINNSMSSFTIGDVSLLDGGLNNYNYGHNNRLYGGRNNYNFGTNSIIGNQSFPNNTNSNFTLGNDLSIIPTTASRLIENSVVIGNSISNESSNTIRMGVVGKRIVTISEKGVGVQVSPLSPTYQPAHNLEVEAGGMPTNRSNIQFQNLPTTADTVDLVVYNRTNHEIFRKDLNSILGSGNFWRLDGNLDATNPGVGTGQNFIGTRTNHRLAIATNNFERMSISNNGNIGIGRIDPQAHLDITNNTCDNTPGLRIRLEGPVISCTPVHGNFIECNFVDNVFPTPIITPVFTVTEGGNTGVRTALPSSSFEVNGSVATRNRLVTTSITLNNLDHTIIANNGATAITLTLPLPTTCLNREYVIARFPGSTASVNITTSSGGAIIQSIAAPNTFTAISSLGAINGFGGRVTYKAVGTTASANWIIVGN